MLKPSTDRNLLNRSFLPLLLLFIFGDVVCDNYIFSFFTKQPNTTEFALFFSMLFLQILASPIQAALSDLYCRKRSLLVSLAFSLLALILVLIYQKSILAIGPVLMLIILFKGGVGNTIPLSWAAISDKKQTNFRFSFGLSTGAFAVAYMFLIVVHRTLTDIQANVLIIFLFLLTILLCYKFFYDLRDKQNSVCDRSYFHTAIKHEIKLVLEDLKSTHKRNALYSFLLWEISLYSILLLYIDFNLVEFSNIALFMMVGYLVGVAILKFFPRISDDTMIKWGYCLSAFSLLPFFFSFLSSENLNFYVLTICYFFHTMGNAFLCATLFAILAKEIKLHEQGRIYGLLESVDTIAFLIASLSVMLYINFDLKLIVLITFSFLTAIFSWFPYARFKRISPKI